MLIRIRTLRMSRFLKIPDAGLCCCSWLINCSAEAIVPEPGFFFPNADSRPLRCWSSLTCCDGRFLKLPIRARLVQA